MELDHICLIMKNSIYLVLSTMDEKKIRNIIPTLKEFAVQQGDSRTAVYTMETYLLDCVKKTEAA